MAGTIERPDLLSAGRTWLPALRHLQGRTAAWPRILAGAGLDATALEDMHARVPLAAGQRLLRDAAICLADPLFGLHAAAGVERATYGLLEFVVASQPDREAGLATVSRMAPLAVEELGLQLETDGEEAAFCLSLQREAIRDPHLAEYTLGLAHVVQRAIVDLSLVRVELPHAPRAPVADYRAWFGAPVVFESERSCVVYPVQQNSRFKTADPVLAAILEAQASAQLAQLPSTRSYASRVRSVLRARLGHARVGVTDAAASLHMSERTLRRRLASEGVTYAEVVDALRRELALALIERLDRNVDALAAELGFASAGAFRRAFQRWTGESPRSYRARLRTPPA